MSSSSIRIGSPKPTRRPAHVRRQGLLWSVLAAVSLWATAMPSAEAYDNIQGSLFTSGLTISAFIVTIATFAFTRMQDVIKAELAELETKGEVTILEREQHWAGVWDGIGTHKHTVLACLAASSMQVTIGMLPFEWCRSVAIGVAVYAAWNIALSLRAADRAVTAWHRRETKSSK